MEALDGWASKFLRNITDSKEVTCRGAWTGTGVKLEAEPPLQDATGSPEEAA